MAPIRVQRKRTKGFKLPPNTVCVTRGTKWGNPFKVGVDGDAKECVEKYSHSLIPYRNHNTGTIEDYFTSKLNIEDIQRELKGKNLACFCQLDQPCHADILLNIANEFSI